MPIREYTLVNETNQSWVLQGSTLLPLLYSSYVNDIPRPLTSVKFTLFVNDTALFLRSNCLLNILPQLQRAINKLTQWLRLWRIEDLELPTISKFVKDASERYFNIASSHPNPLLVSAVSYEPPPPYHFCTRPRNILSDPPYGLTVESHGPVACRVINVARRRRGRRPGGGGPGGERRGAGGRERARALPVAGADAGRSNFYPELQLAAVSFLAGRTRAPTLLAYSATGYLQYKKSHQCFAGLLVGIGYPTESECGVIEEGNGGSWGVMEIILGLNDKYLYTYIHSHKQLITYSSDFGAARLDSCELRRVVPRSKYKEEVP
ncbi:hypothetical protein EVAR_100018_1 [Eumeta japonica]|uniref:Reverse transcriptase domain-containing protein n=1 Tax=Eumeta variegata TaxID=151549 RepID=A0A4C1ZR29_EUMVA|nr:hypothetical protein EVAR_100018_1 [Eumeta japonica]